MRTKRRRRTLRQSTCCPATRHACSSSATAPVTAAVDEEYAKLGSAQLRQATSQELTTEAFQGAFWLVNSKAHRTAPRASRSKALYGTRLSMHLLLCMRKRVFRKQLGLDARRIIVYTKGLPRRTHSTGLCQRALSVHGARSLARRDRRGRAGCVPLGNRSCALGCRPAGRRQRCCCVYVASMAGARQSRHGVAASYADAALRQGGHVPLQRTTLTPYARWTPSALAGSRCIAWGAAAGRARGCRACRRRWHSGRGKPRPERPGRLGQCCARQLPDQGTPWSQRGRQA